MREEFRKLVVGFALESALVHDQETKKLEKLYMKPDEKEIQELYRGLIKSKKHQERALAIWLYTAFDQKPMKSNPESLVKELRKLEYLLYHLLHQLEEGKRQVNNWMNYVGNAAQLLNDGFWLDAKIMLSRALQESERKEVIDLKNSPKLQYEVNVFQQATRSYFTEIRDYPVKIQIRNNLEKVLKMQEVMLELFTNFKPKKGDEEKVSREATVKISSAIRYLMGNSCKKAEKDMFLAAGYMERWLEFLDGDRKDSMLGMLKIILELAESI